MSGQTPDRVPYHDAFWATTIERWRKEGMPDDVSPEEYFGCEFARINADYSLQMDVQLLEETDRSRVYFDENGAKRKDLLTADGWTPGWLDFAVQSEDDWRRLKDRAAYNPARITQETIEAYESARQRDLFVTFSVHACFHPTWQKAGMDNLLVWMIEEPDFVRDMFETHTQLIIDLFDGAKSAGMEFDAVWLSDDLGYRNGPMIGPQMYRDLILPSHKRACDHFAGDGLKTILHSDGNIGPLIPGFIEAGFQVLQPLEAKADLDVRDLKPRYGDSLILFGNIDARRLSGTREEIEDEIRTKVGSAMVDGGYIYHTDHSVPNDVSFDNYRYALDVLREVGRYK
jgi:uroporphyrinogen decarboxylase